ncbi:hypothetical protein HA402_004939 [Bradysia odoriphaga]|nr:hypothetical protein HA402_004939 [Bradysia odoriphaga]
MITAIISRIIILLFGTLYPAYASYKAVRTKNVKEYVKWMMYWIVFALFSCTETFTDIFLSWFPFYYEIKVILVLWLLSPATKGSSTLYRKFVHPMLTRREQEIDEYISQAKEKGYSAVLQYGSKGVNYATSVIMQTALKTIDGIAINKPTPNPSTSASDVTDGSDRLPIENAEIFSSTELNQFEISSDDEPSHGAARSRPVRAAASRRKARVPLNGKGRKKRSDESDDVFIE